MTPQYEVCWPLGRDHYLTIPPVSASSESDDTPPRTYGEVARECRRVFVELDGPSWVTAHDVMQRVFGDVGALSSVAEKSVLMALYRLTQRGILTRRHNGQTWEYHAR